MKLTVDLGKILEMKVPTEKPKINRRRILAGLPAASLAMSVTHAATDEPRKLLGDVEAKMEELIALSVPHLGAGDRYTVVRNKDLDALKSAISAQSVLAGEARIEAST